MCKLVNEREIIQYFYDSLNYPEDDCFWDESNVLGSSGSTLVTTDGMASGVHFRTSWSSPEDIAIKLVEVNISDLVSSGGRGRFAFLNLGLSTDTSQPEWLERFATTLRGQLRKYGIQLVGGDSYRVDGGQSVLNLTLVGNLDTRLKRPFLRSEGRPGDSVFLSGPVGYSQMGLQQLREGRSPENPIEIHADTKHKRPISRYDLLDGLVEIPIHACMDVTDGLVQDLGKISLASNLGIVVEVETLPDYHKISPRIGSSGMLTSGEELELLVLAPAPSKNRLLELGFTCIGETFDQGLDVDSDKSNGLVVFRENGNRISILDSGFLHFP